jgi:hypothetical protein
MQRSQASSSGSSGGGNRNSHRSSDDDTPAGKLVVRADGSSKPFVAQAREHLRLVCFRLLALLTHRRSRQVQCQPQRALPECIFAFGYSIKVPGSLLNITRLRDTALMQINTAVVEAARNGCSLRAAVASTGRGKEKKATCLAALSGDTGCIQLDHSPTRVNGPRRL